MSFVFGRFQRVPLRNKQSYVPFRGLGSRKMGVRRIYVVLLFRSQVHHKYFLRSFNGVRKTTWPVWNAKWKSHGT